MINISDTKVKLLANLHPSYAPKLKYITAKDGFKIPVTVLGQGTPVLLLHAFGMDARHFLPFILTLTKRFCFYLPHFRGFGLAADTPTTQFDFIEQYADDVDTILSQLCEQHDTEAIDVGAISMGALVMWAHFNRCQKYSTEHKVKRYLNVDQSPTVHNLPNWQGGVFGTHQLRIFAQFEAVLIATLPYLEDKQITDFTHLPYPIKRKIVAMEQAFSLLSVNRLSSRRLVKSLRYMPPHKLALYDHSTWQQKIRCLQAYIALPYDYRAGIANITIPVTMLIGSKSALYNPVWQHKIAARLPNAQTIDIPQSGHAIPIDAPIQFAKALKGFLQD